MRLSIYCSNTSTEGYKRLYARLKEIDAPDSRHVFLVPDRFTLGVERDIVENVFPDGYSRVDVASFTRFAVKNVGKRIRRCLSKEGTVVLLEKILTDNSDKLKYFHKLRGYNFAKELFAAIASLRSAGITPQRIEEVCLGNTGRLYDKLSDIAVIMREYDAYLAARYSDTITRIDALTEAVRRGEFADVDFYVAGFNLYSARQTELLKALAENVKSLNIATVRSPRFYSPERELDALVAFCSDKGIPVDKTESYLVVHQPFAGIRAGIFGGSSTKVKSEDIRLCSFTTSHDEIAAAAKEIAFLTRKEGYRYKDIAVVCNDDAYLPYIRETFDRCDIPCFVDEGYEVLESISVRYLVYLMEARDEYVPEKVFRFILHPYSGFTREEIKTFRSYCIKYNIRYSRFVEPFCLGDCAEAEKLRKRVVDKLCLPPKGTVEEYCERLTAILKEFSETTASYAESPDPRLASSAHVEKFELLLSEMAELIPDRELTVGEMSALVASAAADLKTVLRPDNYDAVFVGNTEESRFADIKILFVIGACDGMFPKKSGDGLIFTAADNELMKRDGLPVFPTPVDRNEFEEFVVYDLLSKIPDRLYLSYSASDGSGNPLDAGDAYKEIAYITDAEEKPFVDYHALSEEEKFFYFLATDKNAYREYVSGAVPKKYRKATEKYLEGKGLLVKPRERETSLDFSRCFKKDGETFVTSVSQLETYFTCPYRHFMKYGLQAEEPDAYVLKPSALGTAVHNVLEAFFRDNLDRLYTDEPLEKEMTVAIEREFGKPDYEGFFTDPLAAHLMTATKKECKNALRALRENMKRSDFRPEGFEVSFGYRNDDNKILIYAKDKIFKLRGKIDRVDGRKDDVIIIDYKTGSVKPKLGSIYCGQKVQLVVYLGYYLDKGRRPAGMFYLPIHSGAKKGGVSYAYSGQMLADEEVFRAIDGLCPRADGTYVGPVVDIAAHIENGEMNFGKQKNALAREDFDILNAYVKALLSQGISEILDGYAEKKPLDEACRYCPYKSMCGKVAERKKPTADIKDFLLEEDNDG